MYITLTEVSGTGIEVIPNLLKCWVPVLMSYRTYRNVWYRYYVVPKLPKCAVPVWKSVPVPAVPVSMSYLTHWSVRYRYWCRTELTVASGTGINVIPNLPKCLIPVLMSHRNYRSVRYRYWCRTELTEVPGTGINVVPNLPKYPVPVLMSNRASRSVRYRLYRRYIPAVCFGKYRTEHTLLCMLFNMYRLDYQRKKKVNNKNVVSNLKEDKYFEVICTS